MSSYKNKLDYFVKNEYPKLVNDIDWSKYYSSYGSNPFTPIKLGDRILWKANGRSTCRHVEQLILFLRKIGRTSIFINTGVHGNWEGRPTMGDVGFLLGDS